jgi:DNA-binding beta-propeller fold protein YncE
MSPLSSILLSMALLGQTAPLPAQAPALHMSLLQTLKVGGEGGWDYVSLDSGAGRIYLSHGTRVQVLDLDGKLKGEISDTQGVHGIALAPELDHGFTSNGRANSVTVFKLSTLEVIKVVKIPGKNPDAILFDPATRQVFTFNGGSKDATVLNAESCEILGTIAMGGKPEFAVSDGKGKVFVNNEDTSEILAIDAKARKVLSRWSLKPVEEPSGLAIDILHNRLFSVGGNKLMAVVDASSGKLVATVPTGQGTDAAAFDAGTSCAFASNGGDATLTVIHQDSPDKYTVVQTIATQRGARTMALDTKNHNVYTVTAQFGSAAPTTAENSRPRPTIVPNTFTLLIFSR